MPRHAIETHKHQGYVDKIYIDNKTIMLEEALNDKVNFTTEESNIIQLFLDEYKTMKAYPKTLATEVYMPDGSKITEHLGGGSSGGNVDLSNYYTKEQTYNRIEVDNKISNVSVDLSEYYKKNQVYNKLEVDAAISSIELLPGPRGNDGFSLEYVWRGTELGIRQTGQADYVYVDLIGPQGSPGSGGEGTGTNGKEVELQKGSTYIQWRYVGETTWKDLISIASITGADGKNGVFDKTTNFPELITTSKNVIGSINEVAGQTSQAVYYSIDSSNGVNLPSKTMSQYHITLSEWGITDGFLGEREYMFNPDNTPIPKYTDAEYKIAYDNKHGLQNALNYAKEHGYGTVVMPMCNINICYEEPDSTVNAYWAYKKYPINIPSGITLDMNGSTIKVIFDSHCVNPYDKSNHSGTNYIYRMNGQVFAFRASHYSTIKNGTLIGDIYERAFDDKNSGFDSEKGCEFTTGIQIDKGSSFITIENMKIKGFMGDAVSSMTDHDPAIGNAIYNPNFAFKGKITSGVYADSADGSYTTDYLDITSWSCKEAIMRTNMGYTRVPDLKNHNFIVNFYDINKTYITSSIERYLQNFLVPNKAKFMRLTIINEATDLVIPFQREFQITPKSGEYCVISKCEITENHRGGISNIINNTIIEKTKIYNNGYGVYEGVPQFPDTTRYAINCEDCLPLNMVVRDCYFHSHFNGILFAGGNVTVDNCIFKSMSSCLRMYDCENAVFINNKIFNCGGVIGSTGSSKYSRSLLVNSNTLINSDLGTVAADVMTIVTNTIYKGKCGINDSGMIMENATLKYKRVDNEYRHLGIYLNEAKNIKVYLEDTFVSTANFQITTLSDCNNIKVYGSKAVTGGIHSYAGNGLNNTYVENLSLKLSTQSSNNIITAMLDMNNSKFKNVWFNYGYYLSEPTSYVANLNISNTEFIVDEATTNVSNSGFFNGTYYNNTASKSYDIKIKNCKFTVNLNTITEIFKFGLGSFTGSITFENCSFINNTANQIYTVKFDTDAHDSFDVSFNNCTAIGNFKISNSNIGKYNVNDITVTGTTSL